MIKGIIKLFVERLELTPLVRNKLSDLLLKYDYCQKNKILHYPVNREDLDLESFYSSLVGFINGDGSLKSGKRKGHKEGLYRFTPNIVICIHSIDKPYLELVINILNFKNIKVYTGKGEKRYSSTISFSKKEDVLKLINIF